MKTILIKIATPIMQLYANFIISQLEDCDNLDLYEYYISQGVLIDYCATEHGIYLD
jgi:hypothetical protein